MSKAEIVLTKAQVLDILFRLVKSKTAYNNHYPYNLGYMHENGTQSFDCWNLHKAIINSRGKLLDFKPGEYQKNLSLTGDTDGAGLLESCTNVSGDFSKIAQMPYGTYLYMPGHAGWFIGEFELEDGKVYNVIECTASWSKNVLASYVDPDGTRRHWRGCKAKNGKWSKYGLLSKWIDYTSLSEEKPVEPPTNKCTCPDIPQPYIRYGMRSEDVRRLQRILNKLGYIGRNLRTLTEDGVFGPNTLFALKDFQGRHGLNRDGVFGPLTYAEMTKSIGG